MDTIREGLGDRLAGVFDGTTPDKRVETAFDLLDRRAEVGADARLVVGRRREQPRHRAAGDAPRCRRAGTSLTFARTLRSGRTRSATSHQDRPALPVVVIPTTFAGADVSTGGSLEVLDADASPTGQPMTVSGGGAMPAIDLADPALFETTPQSVLAGSAMNGFNKGIETPYAAALRARERRDRGPRDAAPAGRAPARRRRPARRSGGDRPRRGRRAARPTRTEDPVIHAFGRRRASSYDVQRGTVHAVVAPHVLAYLFDEGGRASRRALANSARRRDRAGRDDAAIAEDVVSEVAAVRDSLPVPSRLRELDPVDEDDFPRDRVHRRRLVDGTGPADLDATPEAIEGVLREAW